MSWHKALENYARCSNPLKELPSSVVLLANDQCLTIFDGYEKAKFHFLVLPRDPFKLSNGSQIRSTYLQSLRTLRTSPRALEVLRALESQAQRVKYMIEDEMMKQYGFKWQIYCGFHAVESMSHVHLHVISSDMLSDRLKNKKHYNSFQPKLGYFLHLSDVIQEVELGVINTRSSSSYEQILKEPLRSVYTGQEFKSIPALKVHLEAEFNKLRKAGQPKGEDEAVSAAGEQSKIPELNVPASTLRDRETATTSGTKLGASSMSTTATKRGLADKGVRDPDEGKEEGDLIIVTGTDPRAESGSSKRTSKWDGISTALPSTSKKQKIDS